MKKDFSRTASFIIIALVYLIASAVGILIYFSLRYDFWLNLLIADIIATVTVFIFSLIFGNASIYDPYWSVQPIVILLALAFNTPLGIALILPLFAVIVWGVRLTANWAYTFHGLSYQDWRYTMLKEKSGKLYPFVNFAGIHMFPTFVVYACILPIVFLFKSVASVNSLNVLSVLCVLISLAATALQGTADLQMHRFKKSGKGGFIRQGLWKYSRHPNYLGEILMWWGMALFALSLMPDKWFLLLGALVNTLMFLFISIPLAEKHQSRKDGYEKYRRQTRMILPIYKSFKETDEQASTATK